MSGPTAAQRVVLARLRHGPATLAGLRAAFPADGAEARAIPSMGERDAFGDEVAGLVRAGLVVDEDGRYRLPEGGGPAGS